MSNARLQQSAQRIAAGFHLGGASWTITTTASGLGGTPTDTALKAPACQESGAYVRLRVRVGGRGSYTPLVAEATVKNYTNPGGWVINSPFVIG